MRQNAGMTEVPPDARWPKLLSLAVHEFRTPITVVAGYIRMLLKERAGPVTDAQRKLLEEAEKSCTRLSALVTEMSDLSSLEAGSAPSRRAAVNLSDVLQQAIASLPPLTDHQVRVDVEGDSAGAGAIQGDATRLISAFAALLTALRREVITGDRLLVRTVPSDRNGTRAISIAIGEDAQIDRIAAADPATLPRFDEWRGGSGLSLAIARRIIGQHGGALLSPPDDGKAGAVVLLPRE